MKERDKYLKIVEWSDEDECYVGSVPGWIGKCCHGDDETKVSAATFTFSAAWAEVTAITALRAINGLMKDVSLIFSPPGNLVFRWV